MFDELRIAAKDSKNTLDDAAVDAFEIVWDVAVPVLLGGK